MFKKFLVFAGWLLLLSSLLFLCFILGLLMQWNTTTILLLWLGLIVASVITWILGYSLFMRIKQPRTRTPFLRPPLSRLEYVLHEHWKSGVKILKRHSSLPWYILLDESGCVRQQLTQNALIDYVDEEQNCSNDTNKPFRTLHWWQGGKVVFLEFSDHFFKGIRSYDQVWKKIINWIAHAPAPAGVVMTISITELSGGDEKAISMRVRKLQARLLTLSRRIQRQLPLYILITGCEKLPAFNLWASQLSSFQQQQPFGVYWPYSIRSDDQAISLLIDKLKHALDITRLSMPHKGLTANERSALLDFPETFIEIKTSLERYIDLLCADTDATDPAGIWFTCHISSMDSTVFLQSLFTEYLPEFSRTRRVVNKKSLQCISFTRGAVLIYCGLLISSFLYSAALMVSSPEKTSTEDQEKQLLINETRYTSPWKYIPFIPLLNYQQRQLEQALMKNIHYQPTDIIHQLSLYQHQFQSASPASQRKMIITLAQSIQTLQDMHDGAQLSLLMHAPKLPETLRLLSLPAQKNPLVSLVLQRKIMQQSEGQERLIALRNMLAQLVNSDPNFGWLTAPTPELSDISTKTFWPDLSQTVSLSGIWTQKGQAQISSWLLLINQVSNTLPSPRLQQFIKELPTQRQNAWLEMLLNVIQLLNIHPQQTQSQDQLIALNSGHSPAMKFANTIQTELSDIPINEAQSWLKDLRHLQDLEEIATYRAPLQNINHTHNILRQYLAKKLKVLSSDAVVNTTPDNIAAWKAWKKALAAVVNQAMAPKDDFPSLVMGLFNPVVDNKSTNLLNMIYLQYNELRSLLDQQNGQPGTDAVWLLYRNDADTLLGYAINSTGCWLNSQWQQLVIWPMRKDAGTLNYDKQQQDTWQGITDFIRGPAKKLLAITGAGPQAGEYNGQVLPFTPQFLNLVHQLFTSDSFRDGPDLYTTSGKDELALLTQNIDQLKQQQNTEQTATYPIDIVSEPATIQGGGRIVPTGITLTLSCGKTSQTLNSMNLAVSKQIIWQPGQCQSVTLKVSFPQFSVKANFTGPGAWPDFLARFENGSALFNANEFNDDTVTLQEAGIQQILIQLQLADQKSLQDAWSQWETTSNQLNELINQQQIISNQIQSQHPSDVLWGKLAQIPDNVALCNK